MEHKEIVYEVEEQAWNEQIAKFRVAEAVFETEKEGHKNEGKDVILVDENGELDWDGERIFVGLEEGEMDGEGTSLM